MGNVGEYTIHGSYGHICKDSVQKLDSSVKELGTTLETEAISMKVFGWASSTSPQNQHIDTQTSYI